MGLSMVKVCLISFILEILPSLLFISILLRLELSISTQDVLLIFVVSLVCNLAVVYAIVLSDSGLLANRTPYAVCLDGCFPQIVDDILTLASREDIRELRKHMYQKGYLTVSVYEELLQKDKELANRELVNKIIQDALRAESRKRVIIALSDSFSQMGTDRNRCQEIADLIQMHIRESKWLTVFV